MSILKTDPSAGSPFSGLSYAGELDELKSQGMEVTMNARRIGYLNNRVVAELKEVHPAPISHVRFLPDPQNGFVIMVPCEAGDYGAEELRMEPTLHGASVNLRLAMMRMKIQVAQGRRYLFPVSRRKGNDGKEYLAFSVGQAESLPARKLTAPDEDTPSTASPEPGK